MKNFNTLTLIVYGFCSIPIGIGCVMGYSSWKVVSGSIKAQGTVDAFIDSNEGGTQAPVVIYQIEGKTYRIYGTAFVSYSAYSVGETVSVVYKPGAPEKGTINSFTELWFAPTGLAGFGLIGVCFYHLVEFRRNRFTRRFEQGEKDPELMRRINELSDRLNRK